MEAGTMNEMPTDEFRQLVDRDVRRDKDNTSYDPEYYWLREPEQLPRFGRELRRLILSVTEQLQMAQDAVDAMRPGRRRDEEQQKAVAKRGGRTFYRARVRDRLHEVEDLAGVEPLVTGGQVWLVVDATLEALDTGNVKAAISYLESLQDALDPPTEDAEVA